MQQQKTNAHSEPFEMADSTNKLNKISRKSIASAININSGSFQTKKNSLNKQKLLVNSVTALSKNGNCENINGSLNMNKENKEISYDSSSSGDSCTSDRVLSFKERKEIFSKKQLQNLELSFQNHIQNSSSTKQHQEQKHPVTQILSVNQTVKRIKIEDSMSHLDQNQSNSINSKRYFDILSFQFFVVLYIKKHLLF